MLVATTTQAGVRSADETGKQAEGGTFWKLGSGSGSTQGGENAERAAGSRAGRGGDEAVPADKRGEGCRRLPEVQLVRPRPSSKTCTSLSPETLLGLEHLNQPPQSPGDMAGQSTDAVIGPGTTSRTYGTQGHHML